MNWDDLRMLVVLDRDIVACPTDDIRQAQMDMTYVDGELVHERTKLTETT